MSDIEMGFPCGTCRGELVVQIQVHSYGCPGSYWEPSEGPEYSVLEAECHDCGAKFDEDQINAAHQARICERISEPDGPDEDYCAPEVGHG